MSPNNAPTIGLFGGRFDPVHVGHIEIAKAFADALSLSQVRWIVAGDPPHKTAFAPAHDRLAMVKLAIEAMHDARMVADDQEIQAAQNGQPTYTADTLVRLQQQIPDQSFIWMMGADQLRDFTTWSRWEWLIQHMALAVVGRPSVDCSSTLDCLQSSHAKIHWIDGVSNPISSTVLRDRISHQQSIHGLTPMNVANYLMNHKLYAS